MNMKNNKGDVKMKKKSIIAILLTLVMCFSLSACGGETSKGSDTPILNASNLADALAQFESLMGSAETDEEKQELETYMNDFFTNDLNGYYYYLRPDKAVMHVDSDNRAIYIKSKEEVYIVPYSETELANMNLTLEDIPQIENIENYKYHIAEIKSEVSEYTKAKVVFESDSILDDETFNSIEITCYSGRDPMAYQIVGYFADEYDAIPETDKKNGWPAVREYFRDGNSADTQKVERDEAEKDYGETPKKEDPAIGMTKEEVLDSSWGSPDDKNIDEYEWGTEEQWVYENRGYIYFENGIVDAIQHR